MALSAYFLGLRAKFLASRETVRAEKKREDERGKIKQDAQSILDRAKAKVQNYTQKSWQEEAKQRVGSWQNLVTERQKYHAKLLEDLVYLNREDAASAKTDPLVQDKTLITKYTEEFAQEQTAAQKTFQQSLQTEIGRWKGKHFTNNHPLPSLDEKHLYEDIAARLKTDRSVVALQDVNIVDNYRDALTRIYEETLDRKRDHFLADLKESTYEFERTRQIFEGKKTVTYAGFSERFLASDRFLTDQIHRDVLLVQPSVLDPNHEAFPTLINRLASPSEGGTIQFGRRWFTLGRGDRGATVDHDTHGLKDGLGQQQDFLFVDQVVNASEFTCVTIGKGSGKPLIRKEELNTAFRALGGQVEGHGDDPIVKTTGAALRFGDNPIRQFLWAWLDQDTARQIAFSLRADGQIRIHVTFCDEETDRKKSSINHVRLVALFVVTEINRILNGTSDDRVLPDAGVRENDDVRIPSTCVWPLEFVWADGTAARDALSGKGPEQQAIKQAKRWMVGYLPLSCDAPDVQHLLLQRFAETSRRHGRVLLEDNDALRTRFGKGYVPPQAQITHVFNGTNLVLVLLWITMVMITFIPHNYIVGSAERFTIAELKSLTLLFVGICLWRMLAAFCYTRVLRQSLDEDSRSRWSETVTRGIISLGFRRRWHLFVGPTILVLLIIWYLIDPEQNLSSVLPSLEMNAGSTANNRLPETASYWGKFAKAIWALPVLGIGLLNQSRMALRQAQSEKGALERIQRVIRELESNNSAARQIVGAEDKAKKLFERPDAVLASVQTEITDRKARGEKRFGRSSLENAVVVALIGLLKPISALEPEVESKKLPDIIADLQVLDHKDVRAGGFVTNTLAHCMINTSWAGTTEQLYGQPDAGDLALALHLLNCFDGQIDMAENGLDRRLESFAVTLSDIQEELAKRPSGHWYANCPIVQQNCTRVPGLQLDGVNIQPATVDLRALNAELERATNLIDKLNETDVVVTAKADTAPFWDHIRPVEDFVVNPPHAVVPIDANIQPFRDKVAVVERKLTEIASPTKLTVLANVVPALAELSILDAAIDQLDTARRTTLRSMLNTVWLKVQLGVADRVIQNETASITIFDGDIVLAGAVPDSATVFDPFGQCTFQANRLFDPGSSKVDTSGWTFAKDGTDWDDFVTTLLALAQKNDLFVLGLADGTGPMTGNLDLAHKRARNVVGQLLAEKAIKEAGGITPIPVSLGSYGWLIEDKLPNSEDYAAHRSVTILACKRPVNPETFEQINPNQ